MAQDSLGNAYSWGISECGELGRIVPVLKIFSKADDDMVYDLDNILKYHLTPQLMHTTLGNSTATIPIKDVISIGCGSYHSFVITLGNIVYSCGLNNYSQLGQEDLETRYILHEVTTLNNKDIVSIKGGIHHSVALSYNGKLYAFGRGDSGQLGVKEMENKSAGAFSTEPLLINLTDKVTSIACGGNHNFAMTTNNDVYSWGYGDMLALGNGEEKDETIPKKINLAKSKLGNLTISQV